MFSIMFDWTQYVSESESTILFFFSFEMNSVASSRTRCSRVGVSEKNVFFIVMVGFWRNSKDGETIP